MMDLTSKLVIKKLLKEKGMRPSKRLGQNFLVSKSVLKKIIEAADLEKTDIILEIGSGIGTLTQELAKRAKKVIAIEKDKKMVEILKEILKDFKNVKIVEEDILKIENGSITKWLNGLNYKIISNLPYYIASPVIRKFLETKTPPQKMILMVQKEVAQRILAHPPKMNLLAISVQFYAKPKIVSYVSKRAFWPSPKVDSALIKLSEIKPKSYQHKSAQISTDQRLFFKIVKAGFSHPRKQLVNNLVFELKLEKEKVKSWLLKNKILPNSRAENLSLKNWISLTKTFNQL